jgi:hypothetical protein
VSLHIKSEAEFNRWRKRAWELRARAEHSPEDASVILELLNGVERLEKKYQKLDKRVRTLEAQVQKAYANYITGQGGGSGNEAEESTGSPSANDKRRAGVVGEAEPGLELESMDLELEPIDLELEPIPFEPEDVQK